MQDLRDRLKATKEDLLVQIFESLARARRETVDAKVEIDPRLYALKDLVNLHLEDYW